MIDVDGVRFTRDSTGAWTAKASGCEVAVSGRGERWFARIVDRDADVHLGVVCGPLPLEEARIEAVAALDRHVLGGL